MFQEEALGGKKANVKRSIFATDGTSHTVGFADKNQ